MLPAKSIRRSPASQNGSILGIASATRHAILQSARPLVCRDAMRSLKRQAIQTAQPTIALAAAVHLVPTLCVGTRIMECRPSPIPNPQSTPSSDRGTTDRKLENRRVADQHIAAALTRPSPGRGKGDSPRRARGRRIANWKIEKLWTNSSPQPSPGPLPAAAKGTVPCGRGDDKGKLENRRVVDQLSRPPYWRP
jgi:hypothetical protein